MIHNERFDKIYTYTNHNTYLLNYILGNFFFFFYTSLKIKYWTYFYVNSFAINIPTYPKSVYLYTLRAIWIEGKFLSIQYLKINLISIKTKYVNLILSILYY